jgi:hypothetical protein
LRSGKGDGVVDAEELVEETGTFAALDVAAAAAGVVVGVEWHGWMRICGFRRRSKRRI